MRNDFRFPPPSRPLPVAGGIKARSTRGKIGQTWWSERFVAVLEGIGLGSRLQRGRNYARRGQVIELVVAAGSVTASVQGSRPRPYRVRIGLPAFGKADWAGVETTMAGNAWYSAALLSGELPHDIEDLFSGQGLSLFPTSSRELTMDCSCPDHAVPCKHLAATFYLLAESFDADPFDILAWRGRNRQDLLDHLQAARSAGVPAEAGEGFRAAPLAGLIDTFYQPQGPVVRSSRPETAGDALLDQLPVSPLTIGGVRLVDLLRPAYRQMSDRAVGGRRHSG